MTFSSELLQEVFVVEETKNLGRSSRMDTVLDRSPPGPVKPSLDLPLPQRPDRG
jgi:hypothetical protein